MVSVGYCQSTDTSVVEKDSISAIKPQLSKIQWGFNVGRNYSFLQLQNSDPNARVSTSTHGGFQLGLIMDWKLNNRFSISPKAEMSINHTRFSFFSQQDGIRNLAVYPVTMQFATHISYRFSKNPSSLYFLIGPNFKLPINKNQGQFYGTDKKDIAIDVGIGFDKMFTAFHISPELRYSYGLRDLSQNASASAGEMHFHSVSLVVNFKD
jgi:Outer membrane protein beta-barrel domain